MIHKFNEKLRKLGGLTLEGRVRFRIVWSDSQLEWRRGVFNQFCGDIFLRQYQGIGEVQKYPYIKGRWILEKYVDPQNSLEFDLPMFREGTYEPLYVFQDKDGKFLPINMEAAEIIVNMFMNPTLSKAQIKALVDESIGDEETEKNEEIEYFEEALNEDSLLATKIHHGEAVVGGI